jgi:RNA polymerase sigma-70 factor (ECF subfamily)
MAGPDDLAALLRAGDCHGVSDLIGRYYPGMVRLARSVVSTQQLAEDVVQDTWLAVLTGIDAFEGRSSLRTWVYAVLLNRARSAANGDARRRAVEQPGPAGHGVDPLDGRFHPTGHPDAGHWALPPSVRFLPEERAETGELRLRLRDALERLPPRQRQVVLLRDVEGVDADEVCHLLEIDLGNLRVLLHRGRAKLRAEIEHYLTDTAPGSARRSS